MTLSRKTQIGLVITAVVLFVLLFLAPKTHTGKLEANVGETNTTTDKVEPIESFIAKATKTLKTEELKIYESLVATAKNSKIDTSFVTVVLFWDKQKRPDLAAYFVEQIALKKQNSSAYYKAGERYYYAIRFTKDNTEIPTLYSNAINCYQKAISLDSKNVDAKIQLAACFVEDGKDPMKGISLLREVEKTDSNNVKLQLSFAFFSLINNLPASTPQIVCAAVGIMLIATQPSMFIFPINTISIQLPKLKAIYNYI